MFSLLVAMVDLLLMETIVWQCETNKERKASTDTLGAEAVAPTAPLEVIVSSLGTNPTTSSDCVGFAQWPTGVPNPLLSVEFVSFVNNKRIVWLARTNRLSVQPGFLCYEC